jgi:hypothetical protein
MLIIDRMHYEYAYSFKLLSIMNLIVIKEEDGSYSITKNRRTSEFYGQKLTKEQVDSEILKHLKDL